MIYEKYLKLERAPDTEEALQQLIKADKEAWHAIDERILENLCSTMPHRVQDPGYSGMAIFLPEHIYSESQGRIIPCPKYSSISSSLVVSLVFS